MSNTRITPCRSAEDRAWDALYRSVNDPSTAVEVVELFDADPDVRKAHLALYLRCRQTVRAMELRRMRIERMAAYLKSTFAFVFMRPLDVIRRLYRGGTDVAIELMPKVEGRARNSAGKSEPAARRMKKLNSKAVQELSSVTPAPASASASSVPPNGAQAFATVLKANAD